MLSIAAYTGPVGSRESRDRSLSFLVLGRKIPFDVCYSFFTEIGECRHPPINLAIVVIYQGMSIYSPSVGGGGVNA